MTIEVRVKLRAKKTEVIEVEKGIFDVFVTTIPEKGKANDAVIKALAKHFHIASSLIEIVRGHVSCRKIISIEY